MSTRRLVLIDGSSFVCHLQNDDLTSFPDAFRLHVHNDQSSFMLMIESQQLASEIIGINESVVSSRGLRELLHEALGYSGSPLDVTRDDTATSPLHQGVYDVQFLLSPDRSSLTIKILVRPLLRFLNPLIFLLSLAEESDPFSSASRNISLTAEIDDLREALNKEREMREQMQGVILKQLTLISTYRDELSTLSQQQSSAPLPSSEDIILAASSSSGSIPPSLPDPQLQQSVFVTHTGVVTTNKNGTWKNVDLAGPFSSGTHTLSILCQSSGDFVGCYIGVLICDDERVPDRSSVLGYVGSRRMRQSYSVSLDTGNREFSDEKFTVGGDQIAVLERRVRSGDIVEMTMDCDRGVVSFALNGVSGLEEFGREDLGWSEKWMVAMITIFYKYQRFQILQKA